MGLERLPEGSAMAILPVLSIIMGFVLSTQPMYTEGITAVSPTNIKNTRFLGKALLAIGGIGVISAIWTGKYRRPPTDPDFVMDDHFVDLYALARDIEKRGKD